jgi:hypothetical protein
MFASSSNSVIIALKLQIINIFGGADEGYKFRYSRSYRSCRRRDSECPGRKKLSG